MICRKGLERRLELMGILIRVFIRRVRSVGLVCISEMMGRCIGGNGSIIRLMARGCIPELMGEDMREPGIII